MSDEYEASDLASVIKQTSEVNASINRRYAIEAAWACFGVGPECPGSLTKTERIEALVFAARRARFLEGGQVPELEVVDG